jgi:Ca2+-binding RTX toxin-like protein
MAKNVRMDWFHWLDNTLVGDDTDEAIYGGDGRDILLGGRGADDIFGGEGNDTLFGDNGADTVNGGDGDDTLSGGSGFDTISGGAGRDKLYSAGEDVYDGGSGDDTFTVRNLGYIDVEAGFGGSHSVSILDSAVIEGVRIALEEGVVRNRGTGSAAEINHYADDGAIVQTIGSGTATFNAIERYVLTDFGDDFLGNNESTVIYGLDGDDVIEGRGGADDIKGGNGNDTIEFGSSRGGVNVNLFEGLGLLNDAAGDFYSSIENVRGSAFGDVLTGSSTGNGILGRGGNDTIAGLGGADTLDGGSGVDFVDYRDSAAGIDVNLSRSVQTGGDAQGDVLSNFENIHGTSFSDILTGNSLDNLFNGGGENDVIDGGRGNDFISGSVGNDTASFASLDPGFGVQFATTLDIALGLNGADGRAIHSGNSLAGNFTDTDTLRSIENVDGSNSGDRIRGNEQVNILNGRGGDDNITGGGGADTMTGGTGNDTFFFSAANDMPTFTNGILALERITDFQDSGANQDVLNFGALRTSTGGNLFFNDGDNTLFEVGEVIVNTLADGRSYLGADLNGDGNLDFAISFDRLITTFDASDFLFQQF